MSEIDPIKFGQMCEAIKNIKQRLDVMEPQITELLEVKNKGKGALAALIMFSGLILAGIIEAIRNALK